LRSFSIQNFSIHLIGAAVLIIAGCSSSGDGGTIADSAQANLDVIESGQVTQSGFVRVGRFGAAADSTATINTRFTQFDRDVSAFYIERIPMAVDECDIVIPGEQPEIDPEEAEAVNNATSIGAGEAIVISSAEGTFTTLVSQTTLLDEISYSQFTGATPLPANLTVDIPGDTFPAFANLAIPAVPAVENFDNPVEDLTESFVFTWTASSNPNTRIRLVIATDRFSDNNVFIECDLADDGRFQLSSETIAKAGMFSGGSIHSAERYSTHLVRSGTSVLALSNTVAIVLPPATQPVVVVSPSEAIGSATFGIKQ